MLKTVCLIILLDDWASQEWKLDSMIVPNNDDEDEKEVERLIIVVHFNLFLL